MIEKHVYWRGEVSAAHHLKLSYDSKCSNLHGHNYMIEVWAYGEQNDEGMIIDFSKIKAVVMGYDHSDLNSFMAQPTAENLAKDIAGRLSDLGLTRLRVRVWEDRDSYAEVEWRP